MPTREEFVQNLIDSELLSPAALQAFVQGIPASERPANGEALARCLVKQGVLTRYQADAVLKRQFTRLSIGQYVVLEQIGAGGMGAVYRARHQRMNRDVAIKIIGQRSEDLASVARRFEREVQAISRLQHPNIVIAHDADECEAGPFLVMEYVRGDDLELIVRRHGPLPVADALDCVLQSARGLEYAHSKGVIHRDIKPANLLRVDDTGCIKITDLGLARFNNDQELSSAQVTSLTQTGNILGTVLFMAPEQTVDLKTADHRCDIYSLGCTLYFLLHGRPPFVGESRIDTVMLHRHAQAPSLREGRPDAPESLDDVFQRMVAKSPGDRYQSMTEVVAALDARHIDPQITPPSKPVAASPSETARAPTEDYWGDDSTAADASVLLVEPSGAQALVIRQFLESLGVGRIERCRTGAELLQALPQCSAHVVISAMHLDDMTGLELAQHLVANAPHKRIGFILITTSLDPANLNDQARGMGVTLLAKPFDDRQLADALSAAVATT